MVCLTEDESHQCQDPGRGGLGDVEGRRPGAHFGENTGGKYRSNIFRRSL